MLWQGLCYLYATTIICDIKIAELSAIIWAARYFKRDIRFLRALTQLIVSSELQQIQSTEQVISFLFNSSMSASLWVLIYVSQSTTVIAITKKRYNRSFFIIRIALVLDCIFCNMFFFAAATVNVR